MTQHDKEVLASYRDELIGNIGELLIPYVKYHIVPTFSVDGSDGVCQGGVVTLFLNEELNLPDTKISKFDLTSIPEKSESTRVELDILERSRSTEKGYILHTIKFKLNNKDNMEFGGLKLEGNRDEITLLEDIKKGLVALPTVPYGTHFFVQKALESLNIQR